MATLYPYGTLQQFGYAQLIWNSHVLWLRSTAMVRSLSMATLRSYGTLSAYGYAQCLWNSPDTWLRSVDLELSSLLATLIVSGTLQRLGYALLLWNSRVPWLRSTAMELSDNMATLKCSGTLLIYGYIGQLGGAMKWVCWGSLSRMKGYGGSSPYLSMYATWWKCARNSFTAYLLARASRCAGGR